MNQDKQSEVIEQARVYTASRATVPARSALWRWFRDEGVPVTSSWIDEAGEGETGCFTELWDRITREIAAADFLLLYAEPDDFPLKGALIEAGIAIGMGKPVTVCLPGVALNGRTHRPVGSWIEHKLVTRNDDVRSAILSRPSPSTPSEGVIERRCQHQIAAGRDAGPCSACGDEG